MAANGKIIQLRALIERHRSAPAVRADAVLETGVPALEVPLAGGLPKGAIVELVSAEAGSGGSLLLLQILRASAGRQRWSALIDGRDGFDPQTAGEEVLGALLWVRCRTAAEAMRSADLLVRDGNLPLVVLDLRGNDAAELRRIPDSQWHRLQRLLEPTAAAFLAFTPRAMIPCAQARLVLQNHFGLEALECEADALIAALHLELTRKRPSVSAAGEALWAEVG